MCIRPMRLGPCMVTYIATPLGLAQINRVTFSNMVSEPACGLSVQCRGGVPCCRQRRGWGLLASAASRWAPHSALPELADLLRQCQCGLPLHQPHTTLADQARVDRPTLCPGSGRPRRGPGPSRSDHLPVRGHLHQRPPVLDLHRVSLQPQHHQWLVASVGGYVCVLSSSCSAWNSAAPVVQTAGGCWNMCISLLGPWG
jgi:hypothetical protein